jgi:signal transduction histidine kinase/putative methionine-R-sulfoxide reductase with GAF domain
VTQSLAPDPDRPARQLEAIMDIAWAISRNLEIDSLLPQIMERVTAIMRADRSTFFVVDRARGELWSKVLQGGRPHDIRLHIGDGLAGWAAQTGQIVNLRDAYDDPRFDRSWDERSGYRTRSLLCVPIVDRDQQILAVIQCLNKQGRSFDEEDEQLLSCIGGQCAVAIESALLYQRLLERNVALESAEAALRRANAELEMLYDIEQQIAEARQLGALIDDALDRVCSLLRVQAGAILLLNESGGQVHVRTAHAAATRFSLDQEQARPLMLHAKLPIRRVPDASGATADLLVPNSALSGVRETFSVPLSDGRSLIGVMQLVNRQGDDISEDALLRMLALFAGPVARGIVVRREREEGERAERLAVLGTSMGALLHDLRTPMTAVSGFVELMSIEAAPERRQEYVERIMRALGHMETMTRDVLDFAKGRREILVGKVYMHRFAAEVRELLERETESFGVKLEIDALYDGLARFDEGKLKRVIFNLARNACQAMGRGGTFRFKIAADERNLYFECADDGPGIPREMEGRLFESFTTHGKAEGTGLGLAMAKKIVDAHCGALVCRSSPGMGATFTITLPL